MVRLTNTEKELYHLDLDGGPVRHAGAARG